MSQIQKLFQQHIPETILRFSEPMAEHTTFRIGGPADIFLTPRGSEELRQILKLCTSSGLPYFILGGGANILVADKGIRGVVISMEQMNRIEIQGNLITAGSGASMSEVARQAQKSNLAGMEFIYAMPGSVGGSVYMNARCYDRSVSDILEHVRVMNGEGEEYEYEVLRDEKLPFHNNKKYVKIELFSYKKTPFQSSGEVITAAGFRLKPGQGEEIAAEMARLEKDRESKGHFRYPCAGSVFKNNRNFGKPSGMLIDEIGLKGYTIGKAKISDWHGNIIINTGGSRAEEVYRLIRLVQERVKATYGYELETEVIPVGEWEDLS